jgi:hypothetical protein
MNAWFLPALLLLAMGPATSSAVEEADSPPDRMTVQEETERLQAELLPIVAELNGFRSYRPVKIEAKTKSELREAVIPALREYYGEDGLQRKGRVMSALGFFPEGYDLETGTADLLITMMGGGYDPHRRTFYVLLDLPPSMNDPATKRMVAAHELTHALQDQVGNMDAHLRRGIEDWDHDFVYNCVVEGMAYVTMMAVVQGVSLDQAPDPTQMLRGTQRQVEAQPEFAAYAAAPRCLQEALFGRAIEGVGFCRALLEERPGFELATLLDSLPASGEQILHYEKYVQGDEPHVIDLSGLDGKVPSDWQPYHANTLGEFEIRTLCETHEVESAAEIAAGWDGCRFRAFEDGKGRLSILGLSAWDSELDASEFAHGLSQVVAQGGDSRSFAVEQSGPWVHFVIGPSGEKDKLALLHALAAIER